MTLPDPHLALHILAVDDTKLNQQLIAAMLKKMGHTVTLASSGAEALSIFISNPPDMVLLDVSMPGMSGFDVAQVMRRSDAWIPIFFISASTTNEYVVEGLRAGADDYLFKPINYEILQSKIRTFQARLSLSQQLREQNQHLLAHRERIEEEADTAREFIKQFTALDKINDPLVHFLLKPAEHFSGDLIAVARTPDDRLHVLLADSAGHGLTAALAVIPITQPFYQMTAKGFEIPAIVREINRRVRDYLPLPRFVAAVIISLDSKAQTIQVWNGGCPAALLLNADGSQVLHRFVSEHLPLGVVAQDSFDTTLAYYTYTEQPGQLLMCSDGATELPLADGTTLEQHGLLSRVTQSTAEPLFGKFKDVIETQLDGAAPADDIALILVECALAEIPVGEVTVKPLMRHDEAISAQLCQASEHGVRNWEMSLTLTAEQLRRLDVVPFLLGITGQVDGGKSDGKLFLVLSELFNNALDHGLLKLDSSLKNQSEGLDAYFSERAARLSELKHGEISVQLEKLSCSRCSCLKICIKDSGEGFDYEACMKADIARSTQRHGRGIVLLNNMCDVLRYSGNGSEVMAHLHTLNT